MLNTCETSLIALQNNAQAGRTFHAATGMPHTASIYEEAGLPRREAHGAVEADIYTVQHDIFADADSQQGILFRPAEP